MLPTDRKPKQQFRYMRIQTRLTVLILLTTIPLLILSTYFISSFAKTRFEANANEDLRQNNDALVTNLSTWLEQNVLSLQEMVLLPDIVSMDAEQQRFVLQALAQTHPYMYLVSTTDLTGINVARNDDAKLSDYSDRLWFQNARAGTPITFQSLIGKTSGRPALVVSAPILNERGVIVGVGMFAADLTDLSEQTRVRTFGQSGYTFIIDTNNMVLAHPDPAFTELELQDLSNYPPVVAMRQGQAGSMTFADENGVLWRAYVTTLDNGWGIITQQQESEILASLNQFQTLNIILIAAAAILMLTLAWFTIRRTLHPIGELTQAVSAIAAGDLNRVVEVNGVDEIGTLASTFNSMTAQLRDLISSLEQRVSAATRNLTLAAEVGHSLAQVHDLDTLLKSAVDLIQDRFNLYYTQVYLLDPTGRQLVLRSGAGEVGQQLLSRRHSLPVDLASLNGTAVVEKRALIVENTETSTIHRPNLLLPNTRSEIVVPLLIGERVVGTLDMQSGQAGALSQENLAAFEALAGQLAIAVENASLLAETEAARATVEAQSRRLIRSGWQDFLNAVERGERIGYTYDRENVTAFNEPISPEADGGALVAAIPVSNEPVGVFKFEGAQAWSEADTALVDSVAHQLGRQVENLRLLAQTDQYRAEAEQALRRLTRQGWEEQFGAHPGAKTGFTYDLNTISQISASEINNTLPSVTHPLEVMGEKIGELSVAGTNSPREEVAKLLSMVGEQLSARVENLRLFEATERSQVEVEKRAHQLAAVAEVSTVSSRELDLDKMLVSVVHLTQRQFDLYHAHIFLYNDKTEELKIAACGWKEDDEHEDTHETTSIPVNQEQSLVARAARTRHAVIVNDVTNEPGWLPNPRLPHTASEMAVPLVIGDQVVGVLDVQSERLNAFSEEDANIQTTLASQVAIALQNARSFAQAQQQAERETMLNLIGQKIRSATSVDAVLQIAARELGHALGAPLTIAQLGLKDKQ